MSEVASIRNNNPGAMWPGPSATKFGSTAKERLKDGQRNQMARFDDPVMGSAAMFDLLGRAYVGMSVENALKKWSGARIEIPETMENLDAYCAVVERRTRLKRTDILTANYLRTPKTGIRFAQAMAFHEAGKEFPLTKQQWKQAHSLAFDGDVDVVPTKSGTLVIPAADGPRDTSLGARIAAMARSFEGQAEIPGPGSNQNITDWYGVLGLSPRDDSSTPWCKLFATAIWKMCGAVVEDPDDDLILLARNGLKQGEATTVEDLAPGDWIIWPRGAPPNGHIGIVTEVDRERQRVACHEGNVSNKVVRKVYTFSQIRDNALGCRKPVLDRRRPNGTKSIRDTVADSPSLTMFVWAKISAAGALIAEFWEDITSSLDFSDAADQVSGAVGNAQNIAHSAGISLTAKLMFAMTAILLVTIFVRQIRQKSANPRGRQRRKAR